VNMTEIDKAYIDQLDRAREKLFRTIGRAMTDFG
jgi:hypothetical protein